MMAAPMPIAFGPVFACLAFAVAPPPLAPREALPTALKVDGDLGEWDGPPTLTLGAADQVAGSSKIGSPADFSARVWIAISEDGIALAGDVADDAVRFPEGAKVVNADHAELWVAFPGAPLPPIAWIHQFGEHQLRSAAECETEERVEDIPACKAWYAGQVRRRASLERTFARQFLLTPSGISEAWATVTPAGLTKPEPPNPERCCAASEAVVVKGDHGWRFEARIGLGDLPPLTEYPLKHLRLIVDVVDADQSIDALESFASSSRARRFGKPDTFNPVTLAKPITWEAQPVPLLGRLMSARKQGGAGRFYFPGKPVAQLGWFENVPRGYQWTPSQPSPSYQPVSLALVKERRFGNVDLYRGPGEAAGEPAFWSVVDGKPIEVLPIGDKVEAVADRGTALHLLTSKVGKQNPLGTGECGSCPVVTFWIHAMDGSGRFKELLTEDEEEVISNEEGAWLKDLSFHGEPDLSAFGFRAKKVQENITTPWNREWRWDPAKHHYQGQRRAPFPARH